MTNEAKFKNTIFVLLEDRSYTHLFNDVKGFTPIGNNKWDYWPHQKISPNNPNSTLKKHHTFTTLPVITTLYNEYASIPYLLQGTNNDFIGNLKDLFGDNGELLQNVHSKVYGSMPSYTRILASDIPHHEEEQFFIDLREGTLPHISVIEACSYMDANGWSMATGGNSLAYAEKKIYNIYEALQSSSYRLNSHIMFLWLTDGDIPDGFNKRRIANIWVSPYFEKRKRIFSSHKPITLKSVRKFFSTLYLGNTSIKLSQQTIQLNEDVGELWQEGMLLKNPRYPPESLNSNHIVNYFSKSSYNIGLSPYIIGHPDRLEGTAEMLYRKHILEKLNLSNSELEYYKYDYPLTPTGSIKFDPSETDGPSEQDKKIGFWLLFTAILLWVLLCIFMLYAYAKKYYWMPEQRHKNKVIYERKLLA